MKKVPVPMEMDSSEFYKDVSGSGGVHYDGDQHNGRNGSPAGHSIGNQSESSEMGVDFVMSQPDDKADSIWEKKMGVFENAEGKFKDLDGQHAKEHDIRGHIDVVGMPVANENHNTHCEY